MSARRKAEIRQRLDEVRERTLWLMERVPDDVLRVRVHDFYSPIGWHFGHVGRTEEYWVVGEAMERPLLDDQLTFILADTLENPRDNRVNIPDRAGLLDYMARTRKSVLEALEQVDLESEAAILADGYAFEFAIQHECQHQETIAEMLQLIQKRQPQPIVEGFEWKPGVQSEMVDLPGGTFIMGSDDRHGYDNEKPAHPVTIAPFRLAKNPVTVYEWTEFMEDGGYRLPELWSREGSSWLEKELPTMPEYWASQDGQWVYDGPWGRRPLHPDEPVSGISAFEADAYATWAGKRLPTEEEWEYAASAGRYPWGDEPPTLERANFGLQNWGPTAVGREQAPSGLCDLAGNAWEWTSSPFLPYDGFEAYPYDGYSKDYMKGEHRVCRGGSWATSPSILRRSFRNWYVPTYRQGFLGLRLADDR